MLPIEKRAYLLKVVVHLVRIKILENLMQDVKCLNNLEDSLDISQPNISRHMTLLRTNNIVDFLIDGRLKCNFIKELLIPDLPEPMKKQYEETFWHRCAVQ